MLTRLPALLETSLELTLAGRDDEYGDVGLGSTGNHGGDERLVTGRIKDGVPPRGRFEVGTTNLDCLALCTLLRSGVKSPG